MSSGLQTSGTAYSPVIDMRGKRCGRLLVLDRAESKGRQGQARWRCRCDCGAEKIVGGADLRNGDTVSCGCHRRENTAARSLKHGQAVRGHMTPEYRAWSHFKARCANPSDAFYPDYGGRGITVCERWATFGNFLADMGRRPGPEFSIDRINNDGNYEPGNCRWATRSEQMKNRRPLPRGPRGRVRSVR